MQPKSFGELVQKVRLGLGETLEDFGKRFGKGANAVYHWEKGDQANVPVDVAFWLTTCIEICDTCGGAGFHIKKLNQGEK